MVYERSPIRSVKMYLTVLHTNGIGKAERKHCAIRQTVLVILRILCVDWYRWSRNGIKSTGHLELAIPESYIADRLAVALANHQNFPDVFGKAEGIGLVKADLRENYLVDFTCTHRMPVPWATVAHTDTNVDGGAHIRHVNILKQDILHFRTVHGFQRDSAAVYIFDCAIFDTGIFQRIIAVRSEFDAAGKRLDDQIVHMDSLAAETV